MTQKGMNDNQKVKLIKELIDDYCDNYTEDPKVFLNPAHKGLALVDYKKCLFVYDKRVDEDGFIVAPQSYTLD